MAAGVSPGKGVVTMSKCLIIGASRGIGREFVEQYVDEGWEVHATARSEAERSELSSAGAQAYAADAADEASLAALAGAVPGDFDLIIHNAGVGSKGPEGPMSDIDPEDWERVMRVNALGPVLAARNLIPKLKSPGGTFAVLSSLMGSVGDNGMGGYWTYRMSKSALNMAVKNMANQLEGDGVGIIALHPGHVQTDMGGASAPVTPPDSVSGMRKVLAAKTAGDGSLFVDFRGKSLNW